MPSRQLLVVGLSVIALLPVGSSITQSAAFQIDPRALARETQKNTPGAEYDDLVWWTPFDWWKAELDSLPTFPPRARTEFMKTIKPFVIVAVTDRIVESKDADAKYRTEAEIRGMLTLKLSTGEELHPVDPSAFDPRTTESIQTLGRAAADVPDIVSSNMFFFMFKSGKPSSTQVCDPSQEGHVSVLLGKRHFGWRLPLSSVLFERTCPSCHESVNGAFRFCPWDGTNLVAPNKK